MPDQMSRNLNGYFNRIISKAETDKKVHASLFYSFLEAATGQSVQIGERVKNRLVWPAASLVIDLMPETRRFDACIKAYMDMNKQPQKQMAMEKALTHIDDIQPKKSRFNAALTVYYRENGYNNGIKEKALEKALENLKYLPKETREHNEKLIRSYLVDLSLELEKTGTVQQVAIPQDEIEALFEKHLNLSVETPSTSIKSKHGKLAYDLLFQIEDPEQQERLAKILYEKTDAASRKQELWINFIAPSPALQKMQEFTDTLKSLAQNPFHPSL
ncbi:MAG: hypothetical protein WBK77_03330 [Alphaproteobacteria bacterium]